jgi:hypothetical protein
MTFDDVFYLTGAASLTQTGSMTVYYMLFFNAFSVSSGYTGPALVQRSSDITLLIATSSWEKAHFGLVDEAIGTRTMTF